MTQNKVGGKIINEGKVEHRGKVGGKIQDSVSSTAPASYVRPKATATPAKPSKKD